MSECCLLPRHRQQGKCNGAEDWKANQNHSDRDEEAVKTESSDKEDEKEPVRKSSRKQDPTSDTVEMRSSTRTIAINVRESVSKVLDDAIKLHVRRSSKSKHHKNKTKHRKDKRKKRRHSKNGAENGSGSIGLDGFECTSENTPDARNGSVERRDSSNRETTVISELDTKIKLDVESFRVDTKDIEFPTTKTDHVDSIRFRNDVNSATNSDIRCKVKAIGVPGESTRDTLEDNRITKLHFDDATASSLPKHTCNTEDLNKDVEYFVNPAPNADGTVEESAADAPEKENEIRLTHSTESHEYKNATFCDAAKNGESKKEDRTEDRKLKRRRKRPRHDEQVEESSAKDPSENNALDEATVFKHRRKKHKHTNEHKSKKHHDVRKAPQDGIVVQEEARNACPPEIELLSSTLGSGRNAEGVEDDDGIDSPDGPDGPDDVTSEPQRLAIKIKLCQECNSRHLQDACPLTTSQYTIVDAIFYEEWLSKHKENAEMMKAITSEDPMSEGYGRLAYDGFESDDESPTSSEQCKTKPKVQREEKQLVVEMDRPLYARDSLPDCLELKITNTDHGLGIYARNLVPMYTKFGPLVGIPVREMDIPDDFSMRHIWEVLSF